MTPRFPNGGCVKWRASLGAYADNELPAEANDELRGHLVNCPECAKELESLTRLKTMLRRAANLETPPPGLAFRVQAALQGSVRRGAFVRRRNWLMSAAAVAALVIVAWRASQWSASRQELAALLRIGVTDHIGCAVPRHYAAPPPGLEEMKEAIGPLFQDLIPVMRGEVPWEYRLEQAHRCHVGGREYVHFIFRKAPALVSIVVTRKKEGESFKAREIAPTVSLSSGDLYQRAVGPYQAAGGETRDYLWDVISNLRPEQNQQMAIQIAAPLRDYISGRAEKATQAGVFLDAFGTRKMVLDLQRQMTAQ